MSIDHLIAKQKSQLKLSIINVDDKYNQCFPSFSFFNKEFKPGNHIADTFPDHFSFYFHSSDIKKHFKKLKEITLRAFSDPFLTIVMLDASIKNQVTMSISHIYSFDKPVIKTLYRAINITTAKAELFTIQYGINQAIANHNIKNIIVITNSLHIARRIFDSSTHLYQTHSVAISTELRKCFFKDSQNCIKFWDCPSKQHWALHQLVDKGTKTWCLFHCFYANSLGTSAKNPSASPSYLSER